MHYLAIILQNLNKLDEAKQINEECLEILKGIHPINNTEICSTMINMGNIHLKLNKFESAELIFKQCIDLAYET
jgi:hypothetical protein